MTERITTPASRERRPTVAVLGAGIAGLTAAHELAERGFVVTVYEAREDERNGLGSEPKAAYPPVKLGGLAASQYSTVGTHDGSQAELRPFPGRTGQPRAPGRAVAGEHGFRFFPAFYLHIWDMFQRIPVYECTQTAGGTAWTPTSRTVYDNVRRVVTKGTTVDGKPSLVFPSEFPRSPAEFLGVLSQLAILGFTPSDVATYLSRLLRYLATSPLRRARELQNVSAYDFLVGHDNTTGINQFSYTPACDALLRQMPRILVALDSQWGDARTNLSTYLQLYLNMDRRDNKADGVLNGPTTESWLDHWYRHLAALGVRFVRNAAANIEPPPFDPTQAPHLRPRVQITLTDGTRVTSDYTVVAVDAPAAEYLTTALRAAGTGGTVARLDGFTTIPPPPDGPLQPAATRPLRRRNPYLMDELGRVPWDRFQTLCGIQYYFDTEFQLLRGHMLLTGTEWALSSINQTGLWEKRPVLDRDGHTSVLSVDIGDFNTPSRHLLDESGRGKAARDCTPDEIAAEVWRQIVSALTSNPGSDGTETMPRPAWYALDRSLITADGPGQGQGRLIRNESPYLVPIVGDWDNRPGSAPWNPHGTSWTRRPPEDVWLEDLEQRNVWQAGHGGYQVHNNSVVFAGTWNKTFTRVTSMESACESGRHAVNAILDHYIWVESGGIDRRDKITPLRWKFPYGFLDQGLSSPIRMPSPAGDYCYVFDIENREPADTRALRTLDSRYCEQSLPHPLDAPIRSSFGVAQTPAPVVGGNQMFTPATDYTQQLFRYLQTWRELLEQWMTMSAGLPFSTAPFAMPTAPPGGAVMPPIPPMPPLQPMSPMSPSAPMPPAPADYTQQLFGYLQAWRQYLEQMTGAWPGSPQTPGSPQPVAAQPTNAAEQQTANGGSGFHPRRPDVDTPPEDGGGTKSNFGSKSARESSVHQGTGSMRPPDVDVAPVSVGGSQVPPESRFSSASRVIRGPEAPEKLFPPESEFGNQIDHFRMDPGLAGAALRSSRPEASRSPSETPAQQRVASPFLRAMNRVGQNVPRQAVPKTLFSSRSAQRAARLSGPGQTPSS
jgi:uncharacterized protein with NAD-binding domain and iron-sulfur cluster